MKASKLTTLLQILLLSAPIHEAGVRLQHRVANSIEQVQASEIGQALAVLLAKN